MVENFSNNAEKEIQTVQLASEARKALNYNDIEDGLKEGMKKSMESSVTKQSGSALMGDKKAGGGSYGEKEIESLPNLQIDGLDDESDELEQMGQKAGGGGGKCELDENHKKEGAGSEARGSKATNEKDSAGQPSLEKFKQGQPSSGGSNDLNMDPQITHPHPSGGKGLKDLKQELEKEGAIQKGLRIPQSHVIKI